MNLTVSENCEILADKILKAIETAEQYEWYEWDSFAGRQIHRKQTLREAQKHAVQQFLQELMK